MRFYAIEFHNTTLGFHYRALIGMFDFFPKYLIVYLCWLVVVLNIPESLVKQILITLPEHPSSTQFLMGFMFLKLQYAVQCSLDNFLQFCFYFFSLTIVLSILRFIASCCFFCIFKPIMNRLHIVFIYIVYNTQTSLSV